jgi:hypothetical protein
VKLAKTESKARAIVDEIKADIQFDGRVYAHVLFIVHELSISRDTLEFTRDVEAVAGVQVVVVTIDCPLPASS